MPSDQDLVQRLGEQARRAVAARLADAGADVENLRTTLSNSVDRLASKLQDLATIEYPFESIVSESLAEARRSAAAPGLVWRQSLEFAAEFTRQIRRKETQEEILGALLESAGSYAPRVGLLAFRGEQFRGWSSQGFSAAAAARFGEVAMHRSESPWLSRALAEENPIQNADLAGEAALSRVFENEGAGPWHAWALRALGKPVAVFVASGDGEREVDVAALGLILNVTALCIENTALSILSDMRAVSPRAAERVAPPPAATRAAPAPVPPAAVKPEPPAPAAEEPVQPAAVPPAPAVGELDRTLESIRQTLHDMEEEALRSEGTATAPTTPVVEAPPPPASFEVPSASEEEALHTDGKRFARLLVTEIKLYNQQRVLEGRTNRDLYVRLKRDIDRSREMYEKRVSPIVSRKVDYLHDEIVRILADNDPSTLGSDYPGPRVDS